MGVGGGWRGCNSYQYQATLVSCICFGHSLTHSLAHSFIHSLTHSLAHSLTRLMHSLTRSLTHSFTHPLAHPPTHPLHSLTHRLAHPLTCSFVIKHLPLYTVFCPLQSGSLPLFLAVEAGSLGVTKELLSQQAEQQLSAHRPVGKSRRYTTNVHQRVERD